MKAHLYLRLKALIWFGAPTLLSCCLPLSAAENVSAPELIEDAGRLEQLGERYRAAGDAAGLAAVEKKLAGMKINRPAALLALGALLNSEGRYAERVSILEEALALKPGDFKAQLDLGVAYREQGQYEKAALLMEKAIKQRPQEYVLTIDLAKCYMRMGRFEQAKSAFAQAKRINSKEARAYIALGYAYLDGGQDAQAKQEFEALIAVDTANPLGYHHLGAYFFKRHQYHEAEEYYRKAVQMLEAKPLHDSFDDRDHALKNLGVILREQGKLAEAEAVYRTALNQPLSNIQRRSEVLTELGIVVQLQGKPAAAEQLFKQAMAACEPGFECSLRAWSKAAIRLGVLYDVQGRNSEAEAVAERIGKSYDGRPINEETIDEIMQLGELYKDLGQNIKAEAALRRIVSAHGLSANLFMVRAEVALAWLNKKQGRLAEAERLFKQVLATCEPGSGCSYQDGIDAVAALGDIYIAQDRMPEAKALAERLEKVYGSIPVDEGSIEALLEIAKLYFFKLGDSSRAEALLRRMLAARGALPADDQAMAKAEVTLAGLYEGQWRWGELEDLYLKAIEVFKGHGDRRPEADALARLAAVYEKEGKGPEAAAARRQAEALRAQGGKS